MDKVKAIKVLKPLVDSYVDYANITMKEEDDNIVEALEMAIEALKALDVPDTNVGDMISRRVAIDALWKALYEYEDETEKQFLESEELDVGEWIGHRIFVQNMNDIDRQTILNLPSAQLDGIPLEWIDKHLEWLDNCDNDFAQLAKVSIKAMVELWKKDRI